MTESGGRALSNFLFVVRLGVFLSVAMAYTHVSHSVLLLVVSAVLGVTFLIDFLLGKTSWIATGKYTHLAQFAYLAGLVAVCTQVEGQPLGVGIVSPFLLLAFNSDAISNSRRWKILLPAMAAAWVVRFAVSAGSGLETMSGDGARGFAGTPWAVWLYTIIPGMATLSRLFFTRTKNLIHTSLDYKSCRVELLSFGMKRLEAVGVRRRENGHGLGRN